MRALIAARAGVSSIRQMQEQWHLADQPGAVDAESLTLTIEQRVSQGTMTTCLESSRGRTQVDDYPDHDTVPLGEALRIVAHLVAEGVPPSDASWQVDR